MNEKPRLLFACIVGILVWAVSCSRQGMTIDKLQCIANPSVCSTMNCSLYIDPDDPFMTAHSLDFNMLKSCPTVFVRVRNYVKLKSTYTLGVDVKLDVCALMVGAKHPIIQTFLGASFSDYLEHNAILCPWGPGLIRVPNSTINGLGRGFFGQKRMGTYRLDLDFTCGQNSKLATLKFYGRRNLTLAD